jgi:hypothetical protein
MALTLTGFVFDNSGNAIPEATVQGYVMADNASTTAGDPVLTDANGKWTITTSTAAQIPMDVKITYGSNVRWIKAGDQINVTDMTVTGTLTVGEDAAGFDFALYSSDSTGDGLTWDASEEVLQIFRWLNPNHHRYNSFCIRNNLGNWHDCWKPYASQRQHY